MRRDFEVDVIITKIEVSLENNSLPHVLSICDCLLLQLTFLIVCVYQCFALFFFFFALLPVHLYLTVFPLTANYDTPPFILFSDSYRYTDGTHTKYKPSLMKNVGSLTQPSFFHSFLLKSHLFSFCIIASMAAAKLT